VKLEETQGENLYQEQPSQQHSLRRWPQTVSVYFSFFVIYSFLIFKKCCVVIEAEDDSAKAKVAEVIEEENSEIGVRVRTMKASKTKGKKKKWEQRTRELKGRMRMKGGGNLIKTQRP
jgi:hypothetical protein